MFNVYKTKQYDTAIFDLSKLSYSNMQSKMYLYEFFFDEFTTDSTVKIHLNDYFVHNIQLNYYSLSIYTNINKILYFSDNQILYLYNKLFEVKNNKLYIYPFILIVDNNIFFVRSKEYDVETKTYSFVIDLDKTLTTTFTQKSNYKMSIFVQQNKVINYSTPKPENLATLKELKKLQKYTEEELDILRNIDILSNIAINFNKVTEKLEKLLFDTTSIKNRLFISELVHDTFKVFQVFKLLINSYKENENIQKKINYIFNYLKFINELLNLKIKNDSYLNNEFLKSIEENRIIDIKLLIKHLSENNTIDEILYNNLPENIENMFFEVNKLLQKYLNEVNFQYKKIIQYVLSELYFSTFKQIINLAKIETNQEILLEEVLRILNQQLSYISNIISNFNKGLIFKKDFDILLYIFTKKIEQSEYIIDNETMNSLSIVSDQINILVVPINKKFNQSSDYIVVEENFYTKHSNLKNVFVSHLKEYESKYFTHKTFLLYVGDLERKNKQYIIK